MNKHLKHCKLPCPKRRTTPPFICLWGGWNAGLGCFLKKTPRPKHKRPNLSPTVLNLGYLKTSFADKDVEMRPLTNISRFSSEFGRASIKFNCPFCFYPIVAYIWSFAGGGKRCSNCGAIAAGGMLWQARRRRPVVDNFDLPQSDILNLNKGIAGLAYKLLKSRKRA